MTSASIDSCPDGINPLSVTDSDTSVGPDIDSAGDGVGDRLPDDSDRIGVEELRDVDINTAENLYIGRRRAEAGNPSFSSGTAHKRARQQYGRLLGADRDARTRLDDPVTGMLTGVIDPADIEGGVGPVEQMDIVREGASAMVDRLRVRVGTDRATWFGVREVDTDGICHFHLYIIGESEALDTLDMKAGVDAFVRSTLGARPERHTFEQAVRVDRTPNASASKHTEGDAKHGATHPFARYVAGSLPHLESVGEMAPHRVRQGALEWASTTTAVTTGGFAFGGETDDSISETGENGNTETVDFEGLSEIPNLLYYRYPGAVANVDTESTEKGNQPNRTRDYCRCRRSAVGLLPTDTVSISARTLVSRGRPVDCHPGVGNVVVHRPVAGESRGPGDGGQAPDGGPTESDRVGVAVARHSEPRMGWSAAPLAPG